MEAKEILLLQNAVIDCDDVVIGSVSGNAFIADEDIPTDIDVLVTHYPPYGILDEELGSPIWPRSRNRRTEVHIG